MHGCDQLELAVRASPFSGAGAGTVDLMLDALRTPACRVLSGELAPAGPVERGPEWRVQGREQTSLLVPLAEPQMLAASCGVPNVSMYMLPSWSNGC